MKRLLFAIIAASVIATSAFAQFAPTPSGGAGIDRLGDSVQPQAIGAPVGSPTIVVPAPKGGGVINIGQAFGPILQPYVDAIVQALIASLAGWVLWLLKTKLNVSIDEGHRDALITALQNQAGSLIADGFVRIQNGKITVPSEQLAAAANEILTVIPDAATRLGFGPQFVADRIVDMIPQTPAGAAMITNAPASPAGPRAA